MLLTCNNKKILTTPMKQNLLNFVPIPEHHLFVTYNLHFLEVIRNINIIIIIKMLTFFRHFMMFQVSLLHICDVLIILNTP